MFVKKNKTAALILSITTLMLVVFLSFSKVLLTKKISGIVTDGEINLPFAKVKVKAQLIHQRRIIMANLRLK